MARAKSYSLKPVGFVESTLKDRRAAPKQGNEGAPDAWIKIVPGALQALDGLAVGQRIVVITWLHQSKRDVLKVHPRSNKNAPLTGVFATRSPDRPNPLGLHEVKVLEMEGNRLRVGPLEAIDGTPVVDIKPILCP